MRPCATSGRTVTGTGAAGPPAMRPCATSDRAATGPDRARSWPCPAGPDRAPQAALRPFGRAPIGPSGGQGPGRSPGARSVPRGQGPRTGPLSGPRTARGDADRGQGPHGPRTRPRGRHGRDRAGPLKSGVTVTASSTPCGAAMLQIPRGKNTVFFQTVSRRC